MEDRAIQLIASVLLYTFWNVLFVFEMFESKSLMFPSIPTVII
jgi:hypothetical protein